MDLEGRFSRNSLFFSLLAGKIRRRPVRSGLPPPPPTPAQFRFPGGVRIVFDFPWLCSGGRGGPRSLSPGIGPRRQKSRPGLWPSRTLSRRNSHSRTETCSNVDRDRFESAWQGGLDLVTARNRRFALGAGVRFSRPLEILLTGYRGSRIPGLVSLGTIARGLSESE
jgi:hypothetical protein